MESIENMILQLLKEKKITHEIFEHEPVYTCEQMAKFLNTSSGRIAKSLLLKTSEGSFVLTVLPGDKKVNHGKLARAVGTKSLALASSEEVLKIAKCAVGCVYPLGNIIAVKTYFDKGLLSYDHVYFNPGSHTKSIKISIKDLINLVNPEIIEFKREVNKREVKMKKAKKETVKKEAAKKEELGITVKKSKDFSEWYTQVVRKAELADYAAMKGFIVFMPYGYAIWERIASFVDKKLKETGHKNAYFPALIPESFLRKEAEHFAGFVPEVFWVTHSGDRKMEERLAIRPTSETIAYDSYARWIRSWRDLPLLLNYWNSVLRAEIKATKPFIRTSEFLWQEGHTAHATREEADKEVMWILEMYKDLIENYLAIPVLIGIKSEKEKFPGAMYTAALESLMPDGKALQMGTSHNLGQNFSKAFGIKFLDKAGKQKYVWQTCWAVASRLIGAITMVHGDDKGLILPPRIAPHQAVIVPIYYERAERVEILKKAKEILSKLEKAGIAAIVDDREGYTPGWKFNEWELKGVPLRIEIGPTDVKERQVVLVRRDTSKKTAVKENKLLQTIDRLLDDIQKTLFSKAKKFLKENIATVKNYEEFKEVIENKGGFVRACWCSDEKCEERIKEDTGATIRTIPFEKEKVFSSCVCCGKKADKVVYFAKAY